MKDSIRAYCLSVRRRQALIRVTIAILALLTAAACTNAAPKVRHQRGSSSASGTSPTPSSAAPDPSVCAHPDANWGQVQFTNQHDVEGYTGVDSAVPGTPIGLYISTVAAKYQVTAYRMGSYGDLNACRVWQSDWQPGSKQAAAVVTGSTNTPSAPWQRSLTVETKGWIPGAYLFRIGTDQGSMGRFIPFTVRSSSFAGKVVFINADTTWQAYNAWGGYSLYHGLKGRADRARAVTFDRPYDFGVGAADFLGNELPLLTLAERLHLPMAYATDVDLERDPAAFAHAAAILSLGHDEYYSPKMRDALTAARDKGTNIAFFGANAVYRKIRFDSTSVGPDRLEINYKDSTDPIGATDPSQVTTQWGAPPSNDPESSLTGAMYRCNEPTLTFNLTVVAPSSWLLHGTPAVSGSSLLGLGGSEFDGVVPGLPTPRPMEILMHSPVTCTGKAYASDVVYYTVPSGAGVFDASTSSWVCAISNSCPPGRGNAAAQVIVTGVTSNLLQAYAAGPAGKAHPAVDNVAGYY